MSVPRVVPWASWDEWLWVFEACYAEDPATRSAAVARCRTWQLRGGAPHAVEATAALVERGFDPHPSRLAGAMLVTRCVNGLVDAGQQGKQQAVSISVLADAIALPAWLVDLRHAATHNALPSSTVLEAAAASLLAYFYDNYWVPQRQKLRDLRDGADALVVAALARRKGDVSAKVGDELARTPLATLAHVFVPALADRLRADDLKAPLPLLRRLRTLWPAVDGALVDALVADDRRARAAAAWVPALLKGDDPARRGVDARKLWRKLARAPGPAAAGLAGAVAALVAPNAPPRTAARPSLEALEAHCAKRARRDAAAADDDDVVWVPA